MTEKVQTVPVTDVVTLNTLLGGQMMEKTSAGAVTATALPVARIAQNDVLEPQVMVGRRQMVSAGLLMASEADVVKLGTLMELKVVSGKNRAALRVEGLRPKLSKRENMNLEDCCWS